MKVLKVLSLSFDLDLDLDIPVPIPVPIPGILISLSQSLSLPYYLLSYDDRVYLLKLSKCSFILLSYFQDLLTVVLGWVWFGGLSFD